MVEGEADLEKLLTGLTNHATGIRYGSNELGELRERGAMILRRVFGEDSDYVRSWRNIYVRPRGISYDNDRNVALHREAWESAKRQFMNIATAAEEELRTFGPPASRARTRQVNATSRKVFVVHGHDDGLKQTVARLLERLDIEPVILHEQPNKGRTIIEKFEDYADVSFAVVLLTPDDMGYVVGSKPSTARPRARQNVVMELGFFLGLLGRERVAALFTGDESFETPSDYDGVTYIPVDKDGKWKYDLASELQAAGIDVDKNGIK